MDIARDLNTSECWLPQAERERREALRRPPILTYVGVDLGQANDYTAIVIGEYHTKDDMLYLRGLERLRGVPYTAADDKPSIKARMVEIMALPQLAKAELLVDYTGVGRPTFDIFKAADLQPLAISITGGNNVNAQPNGYNVPKRDLVFALVGRFQAQRLKIPAMSPEAATLHHELANFRMKIKAGSTHDSYEAWREADHDDLVLSCALIAWRIAFTFRPKGNQQATMRRLYG